MGIHNWLKTFHKISLRSIDAFNIFSFWTETQFDALYRNKLSISFAHEYNKNYNRCENMRDICVRHIV